ncbi:MAG: hypothetical protein ACYTEX_17080 [Planctomycetota bacterium]|jgi:hypothetical protein
MLASEKQKQAWAKKHARRLERRFKKWQKPLGINGRQYRNYLAQELSNCHDDPLRKSLIEAIS